MHYTRAGNGGQAQGFPNKDASCCAFTRWSCATEGGNNVRSHPDRSIMRPRQIEAFGIMLDYLVYPEFSAGRDMGLGLHETAEGDEKEEGSSTASQISAGAVGIVACLESGGKRHRKHASITTRVPDFIGHKIGRRIAAVVPGTSWDAQIRTWAVSRQQNSVRGSSRSTISRRREPLPRQ